jgi:opacity protein-like surface antigen
MKIRRIALMTLALCATTSPVFASPQLIGGFSNLNPYVGASIGLLRYSQSDLPTLSPSLIMFRAGVPLSQYFAIEGRVGTGLSNDQSGGAAVGIGTYWGLYARGALALTQRVSVYGVAGLAAVTLNRNFGAPNPTDTGLSAGLGADFQLTPKLALDAEWTYLPSPAQGDSNLLSFGVNYAL